MDNNTYKPSYLYIITAIAGIGGFLFGFDTGIIAGALIFIEHTYHLSILLDELFVSIVVFGAFLGALLSSRLADIFGRKRILAYTAIIALTGTALTSFFDNLYIVSMGRFIIGMAIGVTAYVVPLFIAEISPAAHRGKLVLINAVMISGGEAVAYLVDYMLAPTHSWHLMFATGFVPALLLLFSLYFVPNSPRWLSLKQLNQQAKQVLEKLHGTEQATAELQEIRESMEEKTASWRVLFSKSFRPIIWIGIGLGILQQFIGISTIMSYGPYIFKSIGVQTVSKQILATVGLGLVNTLMSIVAIYFVDRIGRRRLLLIGLIIAGFSLSIGGFTFFSHSTWSSWLLIISIVTYIAGYSIGIGAIFWLLIAEIYPLMIRGLAMSFVSSIQWLASFVISVSFLSFIHWFGITTTLWAYGFMCIVALVYSVLYAPETNGLTLEEIENNLQKTLLSKGEKQSS